MASSADCSSETVPRRMFTTRVASPPSVSTAIWGITKRALGQSCHSGAVRALASKRIPPKQRTAGWTESNNVRSSRNMATQQSGCQASSAHASPSPAI